MMRRNPCLVFRNFELQRERREMMKRGKEDTVGLWGVRQRVGYRRRLFEGRQDFESTDEVMMISLV